MKVEQKLIGGSFVLLIAFGIFNAMNFFFHILMARYLSISDYGTLVTLMSGMYLLAVFSESIQLILTKYTSKEKEKGKLKNILFKSIKKAAIVSIVLFLINLVLSIFLSPVLKIPYLLLAFNGLAVFIVLIPPVGRGLMQGTKKFFSLGSNVIIEATIKLAFSVGLVMIGFRVYGALAGVFLGGVIALLFSFFNLRDVVKEKEVTGKTPGIYDYSRPAFICILSVLLFYSIDVVIAKAIFSENIAGVYAIASVLAKAIFWGTQPISKTMFSLTAEKDPENKNTSNILWKSIWLTLLLSLIALIFFWAFPGQIIALFSGKSLSQIYTPLILLGLSNTFLSLTNLTVLYKLSLGKTKGAIYLLVAAVLEIIFLTLCANALKTNITEFSEGFLICTALFFVISIIVISKEKSSKF